MYGTMPLLWHGAAPRLPGRTRRPVAKQTLNCTQLEAPIRVAYAYCSALK